MNSTYFDPAQLTVLYKKLDLECEEFAREHGYVTAVQRNLIAARLMEAARNDVPALSKTTVSHSGRGRTRTHHRPDGGITPTSR